MTRRNSCAPAWAALVVGAVLLMAVAGCADTPAWGGWSSHPSVAQLQKGRGIQPNWVYYPAYEVYHSANYEQYVFREHDFWVTRPELVAPLTLEKLRASPSVAVSFQDAPARHHTEVSRIFPRNWRPGSAVLVSARGD